MTVLFEYDSRRQATRRQVVLPDAGCQWLHVVKKRPESRVFDVGGGETHKIKGHAEVSGMVATIHPPPEVFDLFVEPEVGGEFTVVNCHRLVDYDEYGGGARVYDFVAEELVVTCVADTEVGVMEMKYPLSKFKGRYATVSIGCHVDRTRCRLCGGEGEANANGDHFCGDCQSVHKIRTIPDSVCGHVDRFPRSGVAGQVTIKSPPAHRVPEDFRDYSECNCDQALMYLAIIKALVDYWYQGDGPCTDPEKALFGMAETLVARFEKNYPGLDLRARLRTLEDRK